MLERIVLVTEDLDPSSPQGSWTTTLAADSRASGIQVHVVLIGEEEPAEHSFPMTVAASQGPESESKSRVVARALSELDWKGPGTLIVFAGDPALAYWSLTHRPVLGLSNTRLLIRDLAPLAGGEMSRQARSMADILLIPESAQARTVIGTLGLDDERVIVEEQSNSRRATFYTSDLPAPRHPRSQAGLATTAAHAVEQSDAKDRRSRLAQHALTLLPESIARTLVRILPQRLKDRFRARASWPAEVARRQLEARFAAVNKSIAAGEFPELETPDVSVIIPCYNQGAFLREALLSVFEQTHRSFEIIVVDDGSTDQETRRILETLDWPRTRLIRQENRGLPAARNAAIEVSRGTYVVPLDADDMIAPEFLERMTEELDGTPGAAYAHCWSRLFGAQDAVWVPRPWNAYHLLLSNILVGCVLMRREAWKAVGGYDETMREGNEDWDLWVRLFEAGWGQTQVREPLFLYRKHGISMTAGTEGRFERARSEMHDRHPDLYSMDSVRKIKREWYPWVTVLVDDPEKLGYVSLGDVEIMPVGVDKGEVLQLTRQKDWVVRDPVVDVIEGTVAARGKFVADWTGITSVSSGLLASAAAILERASEAFGVQTDEGHVVMMRRWPLVDPGASHNRIETVEGQVRGTRSNLQPGCCRVESWTAPEMVAGVEVMRDPPEADGPLPEWLG